MLDKFYVGLDLTGFENNGIQRPISRVTLKLDDENILTAGDDSGFELVADCPHATQAMVNSILAQVKGFQYQMYDASDINIDPSMELGDGITASGVYSVISRVDDDGSGFPSASAPGEAEMEDEYPTGGPMTQAFDRKIAETRSTISKTAEEIRLEVEKVNGDLVELSTSLSVQLGSITSSIQDINGKYSQLEQTINGFTLSVNNGETSSTIKLMANGVEISSQDITMSGLVTFQGLSDGTTTINGGCIKTGTIESISIKSSSITGGTIKGTTISGAAITGSKFYSAISIPDRNYYREVTVWDGAVTFSSNGQECGLIGGNASSQDLAITSRYGTIYITAGSAGTSQFAISSSLVQCGCNIDMGGNNILNTSDYRLKKNITESYMCALDIIRSIRTCSFDWKEDGRHENLGFIAQQLETVSPDFVSVSPIDGHYSTKDMKLIPYLVKAIQELSDEIDGLKGAQ